MGTRLKPITDIIPKALVPVGDKPLLQHTLEKIQGAGADEIIVNVHHKAGQIVNFIGITQPSWKATIGISDETEQLLETGGAIKKARTLFTEGSSFHEDNPVLIHNVDILSNVDLKKFYDTNRHHDATLLVSRRDTQRYLLFKNDSNGNRRLVGWTNIATGEVKSPYADLKVEECEKLAFAGIHLFSPRLFSAMDEWPERFSIIDFYLKNCADHDICGYVKDDLRLLDVGKLNTLDQAQEFLMTL